MQKILILLFSLIIVLNYSCNEKYTKTKQSTPIQIPKNEINYLKLGRDIALSTKAVLGSNLMQTISKKGTEEAIKFCNTNANLLTDSTALLLNAKVKRVSDKNRNPKNYANKQELDYINSMKEVLKSGGKLNGKIIEHKNKMIGYYPIITNQACLQCHGNTKNDIEPKVLEKIDLLYPKDLAINYKNNELRGIWVIEMDK